MANATAREISLRATGAERGFTLCSEPRLTVSPGSSDLSASRGHEWGSPPHVLSLHGRCATDTVCGASTIKKAYIRRIVEFQAPIVSGKPSESPWIRRCHQALSAILRLDVKQEPLDKDMYGLRAFLNNVQGDNTAGSFAGLSNRTVERICVRHFLREAWTWPG